MGSPTEVSIQLTNRYNSSGVYCSSYYVKSKNEFSTKNLDNLLDELVRLNVKTVRFVGGEPLLRDDIGYILKLSKSKGFYVVLNTDGTLLHKNLDIIKYVDFFVFSLDVPNQFSEQSRVFDLIDTINFSLETIVTKSNLSNLNLFCKFVGKIKEMYSNFIEWSIRRPTLIINNESLDKFELKKLRDKLFYYNSQYKISVNINSPIPLCAVKGLSRVCKGASNPINIFIRSDGNVFSNFFMDNCLGNIHELLLQDIWHSKSMKIIRNYRNVSRLCKECHMLEICNGGLKEDKKLIKPDNINPLLSIVLPSVDKKTIESLERQRCRKSVFEVITSVKFHSDKIRINKHHFSDINCFGSVAKSNKLIFLEGNKLPEDFILKHMEVLNSRNIFVYPSKEFSGCFSVSKEILSRYRLDNDYETSEFRNADFLYRARGHVFFSGEKKGNLDWYREAGTFLKKNIGAKDIVLDNFSKNKPVLNYNKCELASWHNYSDRVYFGSEFCERLLPSNAMLKKVKEKNEKITFVTPPLTDIGIEKVLDLINVLDTKDEIMINDWGLYETIKKKDNPLIFGRILGAEILKKPREYLEILPGRQFIEIDSKNRHNIDSENEKLFRFSYNMLPAVAGVTRRCPFNQNSRPLDKFSMCNYECKNNPSIIKNQYLNKFFFLEGNKILEMNNPLPINFSLFERIVY
ncbi:MAG: radical SAM protein [Nanobdellota archaeon]